MYVQAHRLHFLPSDRFFDLRENDGDLRETEDSPTQASAGGEWRQRQVVTEKIIAGISWKRREEAEGDFGFSIFHFC